MASDLVRAHVGAKSATRAKSGPPPSRLGGFCERVARLIVRQAGGTPDELGIEAFIAAYAPEVDIHYVPASESAGCALAMPGVWLVPEWISPARKRRILLYLAAAQELNAWKHPGGAKAFYRAAMRVAEALGGPGLDAAETCLDQAELLARTLRHAVDPDQFRRQLRRAKRRLARAVELGARETMSEDVAIIEQVLATVPRSSAERQRIVDALWREAGHAAA